MHTHIHTVCIYKYELGVFYRLFMYIILYAARMRFQIANCNIAHV